MSDESLRSAGILLVVFPTVVGGGVSILWLWLRGSPYYDHPSRPRLWAAGHAHAGVILILSLVALVLVDHAALGDGWKRVVRTSIPAAAVLVPAAFFLSVVRPRVDRPNRLILLAPVGAGALSIGLVALGIGLLRAA
ncbi:MAG TPA: hypothetical protein VM263_08100 [Acidimicrobiales bacterium]|jgi:uncharacterized membrane protein|nr:hypothetical protein [Acidimicrobiales bacterium]